MADAAPLLDAEHAAFIESAGLSINAASAGADGFGNLARCLGCRVSAGRDRVALFLAQAPAAAFLADIARNGRVAAVFSLPATHRTVQLKGDDARLEALQPGDLDRVKRACDGFVAQVVKIGFAAPGAYALLAAPDADIVAVTFTPLAAFSQTPGPKAGTPLARTP